MNISKLKLFNFRNYKLQTVEFSDTVNVIFGANAQGKTNILEAIYIASNGFSHRTADIRECLRWKENNSAVAVALYRRNVEFSIRYQLSRLNSKKFTINDSPVRPSELAETFNVVLFCPEDLWMIKGAPKLRRTFLDQEISQASRVYAKTLLKFNRVLQQRNSLLKNINARICPLELLADWDEQFAVLASRIIEKRFEALKRISMLANLAQRKLSSEQENLQIVYNIYGMTENIIPGKDWYLEQLKRNVATDIARMSTTIGPQRDDFDVLINDYDCKHYGSQGQQRSSILALKLAELEYIKSETGDYPVMLLDDVMSELDHSRQQQLLNNLAGKVQTFITTTDSSCLDRRDNIRMHRVANGEIFE
ncbi:MAG: DNA replication/repair protein RecF [Negativicutes bacterium]|jgi:DNA replication and repair protein RecF